MTLDCPSRWRLATLGELTAKTRPICYGVLKPGAHHPDGVPLVRIVDMAEDRLAVDGYHRISGALDQEFARSRLRGGEVLLSIQGTIGRTAIVPDRLAGANISRTVAVIETDEALDPRFLHLYFQLLALEGAYETGGSTRQSLNISTIREMSVPVPEPEEQQGVVSAVESHFASLASAEDSLRRAASRLGYELRSRGGGIRLSILKHAFAGRMSAADLS